LPITLNFTDAYGTVQINDVNAPIGASVEAVSPRGDVVGCFTVNSSGQYGAMRIYGEDSSVSPAIPGMRAGETVTFKINGQSATSNPTLVWQNDKSTHKVDLNTGVAQQTISLQPGWNLISLNVEPTDPTVAQVLSSLSGNYSRILAVDGAYVPTLPASFNTLKELHAGKAYYLYYSGSTSTNLVVMGTTVAATQPIALQTGWNWIGYLPQTTLPVANALTSISGKYQRVLGLTGSYIPALPTFSTLKELTPGQGYLIFMDSAVNLTYPSTGGRLASLVSSETIGTCQDVTPTPFTSLVYGSVTLNGQPAPIGTNISLITPDGEIAGCVEIKQAGQFGLMYAYGADVDNGINGFQAGEPLTFLVNDRVAQADANLTWQNDRESHTVALNITIERIYLPMIQK
jgi:hypothetical protein